MSTQPAELKYTRSHEWVRTEQDGTVTVGITDHAQGLLGDIVFIELPEPGRSFDAGTDCAVIESVKAASDIYSPLGGEITDANTALNTTPELVNQSPYGDGWIFRLRPADSAEIDTLLDADAYAKLIASDA